MKDLPFFFRGGAAGTFDRVPGVGRHRYEPYRSGTHLAMREELRLGRPVECTMNTAQGVVRLLVSGGTEYGVLEVEHASAPDGVVSASEHSLHFDGTLPGGLEVRQPDRLVNDMLWRCKDAGVELRFVSFWTKGDALAERAHREAAIAAVAEWCWQASRLHGVERASLSAEWAAEAHRAAQTSVDTIRGRQVDAGAFFGPLYDWRTQTVLMSPEGHTAGHVVGSGPSAPAGASGPVVFARTESDWGFADAFLNPAHAIGARGTPARDLLVGVVEDVLFFRPKAFSAWRWDGDWSKFFDAGRERGRPVVWTVTLSSNSILAICASAT